ncbi:uncharacterized protein LOC107854735 [Capsicum annuum]|uniref:uncharacterized protein LOC107854735 n=1 Tax=Capsicum annuum TaxID=4072 RepID=UPI0007BEAE64|nr:uncharacterized protein LOC107854735 [Capsicum annuum]
MSDGDKGIVDLKGRPLKDKEKQQVDEHAEIKADKRRKREAMTLEEREHHDMKKAKKISRRDKEIIKKRLWYSGNERHRNEVGILVDEELRVQVVKVKRINNRLMTVKLVIGGSTLIVYSVHASHMGLDREKKIRFWEVMDEVARGVPSFEKIVIAGDFNGHIGALPGGFGDVQGGFGFGERNEKRGALLDFAKSFGLVVVNSSFPKKDDHLITF